MLLNRYLLFFCLVFVSVSAESQINITIDPTIAGTSVPVNFVGFSFDPTYMTQFFGTSYNSNNSRAITQQLFNNFYPYQKPDVRFLANNGMYWKNGNFSSAPTAWNVALGYTCTSCLPTTPSFSGGSLQASDLNNYSGFLAGLSYKPTTLFGVNLAYLDPSRAADFASTVKTTFSGYNYLFEIGNEPDAFVSNNRRLNTYSSTESTNEFNLIANAISAYGNVAGPALAKANNTNSGSWSGQIGTFITNAASALNIITMHDYPLGSSTSNGSSGWLYKYLSNSYSFDEVTNLSSGLAPSINTCVNKNISFRLGEANSISNSGVQNVSDAFGSALWTIDIMFELAKAGASGINIMTAGGSSTYYSPFLYSNSFVLSPDKVRINPMYYGMLMFSRCVQNGAQIISATPQYTSNPNIKAWAVKDANNVIRVLIINRGTATTDVANTGVTISIPNANAIAKQYDLLANGGNGITGALGQTVAAGSTFTIAGQNISTTTGALQGTATYTILQPSNNSYTFNLPAASVSYIETTATNDFYSQAGDISQAINWNTKSDGTGFALGNSVPVSPINFHSIITQSLSNPFNITNGNLIIENASTLTVNTGGSITLGPTSELSVNTGSTLNLNGNLLALQSSSNGTAAVNQIGGYLLNASYVNIQRYIGTDQHWRMIGFPFIATTTISANSLYSMYGNGYNAYTYNESADDGHYGNNGTVNAGWVQFTSGTVTSNNGILLMGGTPSSTISYSGPVNTGTQSIALSYSSGNTNKGWNLIANPFPSNINWTTIASNNTSNLDNAIYRYDPVTTAYASYVNEQNTGNQSNVIENGAGFFVHSTGATTLSIQESDKTSSAPLLSLMGSGIKNGSVTADGNSNTVINADGKSIIKMALIKEGEVNGDEVIVRWGVDPATDNFDGKYDAYDMGRTVGADLSVIGNDGTAYSIFHGSALQTKEQEQRVIALGTKNMTEGNYSINASLLSAMYDDNEVYLIDHYTHQATLISTASANYPFIVTSDNNSSSISRFSLLLNYKAKVEIGINEIILLNNPSSVNQFNIVIGSDYQRVNWQLIDNSGRVMEAGTFNGVTKGVVNIAQTQNLVSGTYYIKLIEDGKVLTTKKWIKQ